MNLPRKAAAPLVSLIVLAMHSCMNVQYLKTEKAKPAEITGTYTLLLHGGRYSDDVENVAVIDKEGDAYYFEIFAPPYDYTAQNGVPASEALEKAKKHVRSYHAFLGPWLGRILDREGNVIGYEIRPLYHPLEFGLSDILYIDYGLKDNRVIVKIRMRYEVQERDIFHNNRPGGATD
ncbi:MAG: hypothetical protein C4538_07165 [Nitrospiraceae bacterium]|nr:MAG: hypothetical protein C4538_07165 [Nitrospiraceae bacterium]